MGGQMKLVIAFSLNIIFLLCASAQAQNTYEVYAVQYATSINSVPVSRIAVDTKSADSVRFSYYVWYLQGNNGKKILVDTGFLEDTTKPHPSLKQFQRVDSALGKLGVNADEITDVIITHPHYDHIGGVHLFKKATVWMQRKDFVYFVADAWQKGASRTGLEKLDVSRIIDVNLEGRLQFVDGDSIEIMPGIRVFTGSKHTYESQCVLVDTKAEKVLIASDDCWFYYNLEHLVSIPLTFDRTSYVSQLRRMRSLVSNVDLIIPGHDALVASKFIQVVPGVLRIR
jgi:glyoxylase-like metal-dependent hydrolase (beta-lactamase superfamily II)